MRLLSCQEKTISQAYDIEALKAKIRQCDVCAHAVKPLPVVPNPILQGNAQSKIRIIGQAPGTLAHASGRPFTDPSGVRLRDWLGVSELTGTRLTLLVGMYAVKNYLGKDAKRNLTETVRHWKDYGPDIMPLPHPSWRNNVWIKKHDWFQEELIALKTRIGELLG